MIKRIFKWVLRILIVLIIGILIYGTIRQSNYDSEVENEFQPSGKFSDIGENKIHYKYLDKGEFTFVLIAGLGESMHTWANIANELNDRGRVFMYDRSGLGFSEEGVLPRSIDNISLELNTILEKENIPSPYILIGHSAGGFIARYYAKKYPNEVLGLYLIDPYQGDVGFDDDNPNEWSLSLKMMNWSFRNMSWSGIPYYLLPNPPHPTYKTSKAIKTYGMEAYAEKISLAQFQKLDEIAKDMPLYLLSADNKSDKFNELNTEWHKQIFDKYSNDINTFILIESGHHIYIEKPEIVLNSLDEFITKLNAI